MSRTARVASAAAALLCLVWASPAEATRARRGGFVGNLGFVDDQDIFIFPGRIGLLENHFELDFGDRFTGQAIYGDPSISGLTLGIAVNRPQSLNNIDQVDDLALFSEFQPGFPADVPVTEVGTLLVGIGDRFGLRLSLTGGSLGRVDDTGTEEQEFSSSVTGFEVGAGYSVESPDNLFDVSLALRLNGLETVAGEDTPFTSSGTPTVVLGGRAIFARQETTSWVGVLSFGLHGLSGTYALGDETTDLGASALAARLSFGPRIDLSNYVTVVTLASFGYGSVRVDQEDDAAIDSRSSAIAFPGFETGLELHPLRWLDLRWGFQSRYLIESNTLEDGDPDTDASQRLFRSAGTFGWAAGAGVNLWDFNFDASVTELEGRDPTVLVSLAWTPAPSTLRRPPPPLRPPASPYDEDYGLGSAEVVGQRPSRDEERVGEPPGRQESAADVSPSQREQQPHTPPSRAADPAPEEAPPPAPVPAPATETPPPAPAQTPAPARGTRP